MDGLFVSPSSSETKSYLFNFFSANLDLRSEIMTPAIENIRSLETDVAGIAR